MKIVVLSCNTGGGHNSCGRYIVEEFKKNNIECDFKNYLDIVGKKTSDRIEKLYLNSTKGKGRVFKGVYRLGEIYNNNISKSPVYLFNKLAAPKVLKFINEHNYDVIICTHLFPSMAITELKKENNLTLINIATDYECVPFWNETNPDLFVIPSKLLTESFVQKGMNKKVLLPTGIPVASSFNNVKSFNVLPKDKDVVLLVSGSMGFGNLLKLVNKILKEVEDIYLLVICGNNKKMQDKLEKLTNPNLIVKGFVNNMNAYINESTIVITKPGGLTTSEVVTINKPLIHMMPIPGVETYNAKFFADNKMSLKASNEREVIDKLKILLKDKKLQKELVKNQSKIINKDSCRDFVEYVIKNYK